MTLDATTREFPFVSGGTLLRDGAVVGCWVHDRHDLVLHPPSAREGGTLWLGWREGTRALALSRPWPSRGRAPTLDDVAPDPEDDALAFHELLLHLRAHVAEGSGAVEPMGWWADDRPGAGRRERTDMLRRKLGRLREGGQADVTADDVDAVLRDAEGAYAAMAPFLRTLDPDALLHAPLSVRRRDDLALYAMTDRTFVPGAPLAAALEWHPRMRHACADWCADDPVGFASSVAQGREAFAVALRAWSRERFGRRASDLAFGFLDVTFGDRPPEAAVDFRWTSTAHPDAEFGLAVHLARLPASWVPRTAEDWSGLGACLPAVRWAVTHGRDRAGSLLGASGDWSGLRTRLAAAHGGPWDGARELDVALRGIGDMVRSFACQVSLPAHRLVHSDAPYPELMALTHTAFDVICSGRGLRRILEASRAWHTRQAAIALALPRSAAAAAGWPAVLPDVELRGRSLVVLTDADALVAEGTRGADGEGRQGLSHCVGGYASECLSGSLRILSVRVPGPDGPVRSSTAAVKLRGGTCAVEEHSGRGNALPSAEDRAALADYVAAINAGTLATSATDLPGGGEGDRTARRCGYEWDAPGAWETARDLWDPLLPRPARGASMESLAAAVTRRLSHGIWHPEPWRPGTVRDD